MRDGPAPAATVDLAPLFSASPQDRAYDVYRELRERAPVMRVAGQRAWLVSRYDEVRAVVRDPDTWSSRDPEPLASGTTEPPRPSPRAQAVLAQGARGCRRCCSETRTSRALGAANRSST